MELLSSSHTTLCCSSFDELLELSQRGDNRTIDMLVGDIYGGMDYSKVSLNFIFLPLLFVCNIYVLLERTLWIVN